MHYWGIFTGHFFLGAFFAIFAVLFLLQMWQIPDYTSRKAVRRWMKVVHNLIIYSVSITFYDRFVGLRCGWLVEARWSTCRNQCLERANRGWWCPHFDSNHFYSGIDILIYR